MLIQVGRLLRIYNRLTCILVQNIEQGRLVNGSQVFILAFTWLHRSFL